MEMDKKYHGMELPGKMKMAISGCMNSCSEPAVRDIGLMGTPKGYTLLVGGNAGMKPRLGDVLTTQLEPGEALGVIDKILEYYKATAKHNERLGEMIDRIGLDTFKQAVLA
jgi:NAD(P)H-nitrite reductase large subunit